MLNHLNQKIIEIIDYSKTPHISLSNVTDSINMIASVYFLMTVEFISHTNLSPAILLHLMFAHLKLSNYYYDPTGWLKIIWTCQTESSHFDRLIKRYHVNFFSAMLLRFDTTLQPPNCNFHSLEFVSR